jgi:hypothetical protein
MQPIQFSESPGGGFTRPRVSPREVGSLVGLALALVVAASCSTAGSPTAGASASVPAAPSPTPELTAELAAGMCNIPDLVGMEITKTGAPVFWKAAGFSGEVTEVGDTSNWVVAIQSPAYPGTAPCTAGVTVSEGVQATPPVTPSPNPTPAEWSSVPQDALAAACGGTALPYADAYAGTVHPLAVMVDGGASGSYGSGDFDINDKWYTNIGWPSPIQLVVCVTQQYVTLGSCGTYKRSDGVVGKVVRERDVEKVRVIVALTAEVLQSKTFYGSTPACAKNVTIPSDPPPWTISGNMVDLATINDYATAVSTQSAP